MIKLAVISGVFLIVVSCVVTTFFLSETAKYRQDAPPAPPTPEEIECRAFLAKLHTTWKKKHRRALLDSAFDNRSRLISGLVRILNSRRDLTHEAVVLAGHLRVSEVRATLVEIAADKSNASRLRAEAVRSAHSIRPWGADALLQMLEGDADAAVLADVLGLLGDTSIRRVAEVIPFLGHGDEAVRDSALAAIPEEMDRQEQDALLEFVIDATGQAQVTGVRALGKSTLTPEAELYLDGIVGGPDAELNQAILGTLAAKSSQMTDLQNVLRFALDPQNDMASRVTAFLCLERTGRVPLDELRSGLRELGPLPRYYAARCLLVAGDSKLAGESLMWIVDRSGNSGDEESARAASRKLLGIMAGTSPYATRSEWASFVAGLDGGDKPDVALPAAPIR